MSCPAASRRPVSNSPRCVPNCHYASGAHPNNGASLTKLYKPLFYLPAPPPAVENATPPRMRKYTRFIPSTSIPSFLSRSRAADGSMFKLRKARKMRKSSIPLLLRMAAGSKDWDQIDESGVRDVSRTVKVVVRETDMENRGTALCRHDHQDQWPVNRTGKSCLLMCGKGEAAIEEVDEGDIEETVDTSALMKELVLTKGEPTNTKAKELPDSPSSHTSPDQACTLVKTSELLLRSSSEGSLLLSPPLPISDIPILPESALSLSSPQMEGSAGVETPNVYQEIAIDPTSQTVATSSSSTSSYPGALIESTGDDQSSISSTSRDSMDPDRRNSRGVDCDAEARFCAQQHGWPKAVLGLSLGPTQRRKEYSTMPDVRKSTSAWRTSILLQKVIGLVPAEIDGAGDARSFQDGDERDFKMGEILECTSWLDDESDFEEYRNLRPFSVDPEVMSGLTVEKRRLCRGTEDIWWRNNSWLEDESLAEDVEPAVRLATVITPTRATLVHVPSPISSVGEISPRSSRQLTSHPQQRYSKGRLLVSPASLMTPPTSPVHKKCPSTSTQCSTALAAAVEAIVNIPTELKTITVTHEIEVEISPAEDQDLDEEFDGLITHLHPTPHRPVNAYKPVTVEEKITKNLLPFVPALEQAMARFPTSMLHLQHPLVADLRNTLALIDRVTGRSPPQSYTVSAPLHLSISPLTPLFPSTSPFLLSTLQAHLLIHHHLDHLPLTPPLNPLDQGSPVVHPPRKALLLLGLSSLPSDIMNPNPLAITGVPLSDNYTPLHILHPRVAPLKDATRSCIQNLLLCADGVGDADTPGLIESLGKRVAQFEIDGVVEACDEAEVQDKVEAITEAVLRAYADDVEPEYECEVENYGLPEYELEEDDRLEEQARSRVEAWLRGHSSEVDF